MENVKNKGREEFEKSFQFAEHQLIWDERVGRYVSDQTQYLWGGYLAARKKAQEELVAQLNISILCDKELGKRDAEIVKLKEEIESLKSQLAVKDSIIKIHENEIDFSKTVRESQGLMIIKLMERDEKYKQGSER